MAAIAIKLVPQLLSRTKEPAGLETKGSGNYFWLDSTRVKLSDRELDFTTFQPNSKPGNVVLIEHTCELVDPQILGGFDIRKIMIQLPDVVHEGDEFRISVQETSKIGLKPGRLNSTASDGIVCIYFFNDGDNQWLSDIQQTAIGAVRIREFKKQLVTIDLTLPDDVMMIPSDGAIPTTLNLVRRTPIAR